MKKKLISLILASIMIFGSTVLVQAEEPLSTEQIVFLVDGGVNKNPDPWGMPNHEEVELLFNVSNVKSIENMHEDLYGRSLIITAKVSCSITYVGVRDNKELDEWFIPQIAITEITTDWQTYVENPYSSESARGDEYWAYSSPPAYQGSNSLLFPVTLGEGIYELFSGHFAVGTTHILIVEGTGETVTPTPPNVASIDNFVPVNNYVNGQFPDVDENQWYGTGVQGVVARAFEYGLMKGNEDGAFNPSGVIKIAEALTVAARVHKTYNGGGGEFDQGEPWYQVYVDYAINNDIIEVDDFADYTRDATRAEMAYIFSRSLPPGEFQEQNTVNSLPDVDDETPYYEAILQLYKAGVVTGDAETYAFRPSDNISRAEAAAIITRVILPDTRESGKTY